MLDVVSPIDAPKAPPPRDPLAGVTAKPELAAPLLVDPARVPAIAARPARGPARVLGPCAEPRVGCIDASGCEPADACLDGEAPIGEGRRLRSDAAV